MKNYITKIKNKIGKKAAIAAGTLITAGTILCSPVSAEMKTVEQLLAEQPVKEKVIDVGGYEVVKKEKSVTYRNASGMTCFAARTIQTPSLGLISNVYEALNGFSVDYARFFDKENVSIATSSVKLDKKDYVMAKGLGFVNPYAQRLVLEGNPEVKRFIEIVYDRNKDGKLTEKEIVEGNTKFDDYQMSHLRDGPGVVEDKVMPSIDLTTFESDFNQYRGGALELTDHEQRLSKVLDYIADDNDLVVEGMELYYYKRFGHESEGEFRIEVRDKVFFADMGTQYDLNENRTSLDGKLDVVYSQASYDKFPVETYGTDGAYDIYGAKSATKKITPELQERFEGLVERAYNALPKSAQ